MLNGMQFRERHDNFIVAGEAVIKAAFDRVSPRVANESLPFVLLKAEISS